MFDVTDEINAGFQEISSQSISNIRLVGDAVSIPIFNKKILMQLCDLAIDILKKQSPLAHITSPLYVVGDLHGNFHDLLRIFAKCGSPCIIKYLFLGDYVDRGYYSLETIIYLLNMYVQYPDHITLLRGNHEFPDINGAYGFKSEIESLYTDCELWEKMNEVFSYLPIASVIDDTMFCVHGGLAQGLHSFSQIEKLKYPIISETMSLMVKQMLWNDPSSACYGFTESSRGVGEFFGIGAIDQFFQKTGCKILIRAHQFQAKGLWFFQKKCLTVFSSSGYQNSNTGAILYVSSSTNINTLNFDPIVIPLRSKANFFTMSTPMKCHRPNSLRMPLTMLHIPLISKGSFQSGDCKNSTSRIPRVSTFNYLSKYPDTSRT